MSESPPAERATPANSQGYKKSNASDTSLFFFVLFFTALSISFIFSYLTEEDAFGLNLLGSSSMMMDSRPTSLDIQMNLDLTLEDLSTVPTKVVTIQRSEVCPHCNGAGGYGRHKCGQCNGSGNFYQHIRTHFGVARQVVQCPSCHGSGITYKHVCSKCHGGYVSRELEVPVKISPGLRFGDYVRVVGAGNRDKHGNVGHLLLQLREKRSRASSSLRLCDATASPLERQPNLCGKIEISLNEALLGFSRHILSPSGEKILVSSTVPVQPGQVLEVRDAGLPVRGRLPSGMEEHVVKNAHNVYSLLEVQRNGRTSVPMESLVANACPAGSYRSSASPIVRTLEGLPAIGPFFRSSFSVLSSACNYVRGFVDTVMGSNDRSISRSNPEQPFQNFECVYPTMEAEKRGSVLVEVSVLFPKSLTKRQQDLVSQYF